MKIPEPLIKQLLKEVNEEMQAYIIEELINEVNLQKITL